MNAVRRVGGTVVRQAGPWTPAVHRYLDHLWGTGIDWIPRPLSINGDAEILSFVPGVVPVYPLPEFVWGDAALVDAAQKLRALHDASLDFQSHDAIWQMPAHPPIEVICHNDFAPHNLAFEKGRVVGAIDFDTCSPGSRMWDIAYLATRMVPLTARRPVASPLQRDWPPRVKLLLEAYGSTADWAEVLGVAIIRLRDLAEFSIRKAAELGKPALMQHAAGYERDAKYLEARI
jgi:Ser/Thr protein kinase RdoA (MazF antagonist)